jgi:RND family efflux transporter MFP subunit
MMNNLIQTRHRALAGCLLTAFLALSFVSCGNGPPGPEGASPDARMGRRGQGPPPETPAVAVAVEPAVRGGIASYYSATASLDPNKEADILARVSGLVLEIKAEEGDRVDKGQVLLEIEDDEYRHRLAQAEIELDNQRALFERMKKMYNQKLVAAEAYDSQQSALQAAEAARDLAAFELSLTRVTAPFRGRVILRSVDQGRTVSNGTVLFTMADLSRLLARVHVPSREFRNISVGQQVILESDASRETLEGRIFLISPVIDPDSGTIKVTVEILKYPDRIRPGDFVEVRIQTDRHEDTVLVPKNAVVTEKGDQVAYVVEEEKASRRLVTLGFQDDVHAEILSGIAEGDRVVIQGQRSLKDGQPVRILEPVRPDKAEEPPARERTDS